LGRRFHGRVRDWTIKGGFGDGIGSSWTAPWVGAGDADD